MSRVAPLWILLGTIDIGICMCRGREAAAYWEHNALGVVNLLLPLYTVA